MNDVPMTYEEYERTAKEMFIKYCKDHNWGTDEKYQEFFKEIDYMIKNEYSGACHEYLTGRWKNIFSWHGFMGHVVGNMIDLFC